MDRRRRRDGGEIKRGRRDEGMMGREGGRMEVKMMERMMEERWRTDRGQM